MLKLTDRRYLSKVIWKHIPYSPENKHPFFALNAGQGPHNSGQNGHNAGRRCLFFGGAYFWDYMVYMSGLNGYRVMDFFE